MCGIAAIFSQRSQVSAEALTRAIHALEHRGPDAHRHWVGPHGRAGLGHSRLSIIDLSTGDQPIANEDGSLHVVVNGEFYDFEAIRNWLEGLGHRFRTQSDSEIALHLYEEYGAGCLEHLRGEFAFVIWDERNQTVFAARDRFGIKPLFYARHGDQLLLASEAKALLAAGVPAGWDSESVHQVSSCVMLSPSRTLFAGVHQVPAAHYLLATAGSQQVLRYWDFDYPVADRAVPDGAARDYAEELREKLDEAVRLRLRADVPVGCYLSGGLDSCAVLGLAARHLSRPIRAFTLSFDRPEYDERSIAEEMAARAGAEFVPIEIRAADLAENFADAVVHGEVPFINAHGVAKFMLSRAVRDAGYKVVLTGEGSDEIFAGYPHFRRDMVLYNSQGQNEVETQRLLQELDRSNAVSRGVLSTGGQSVAIDSMKRSLGFVPSFFEVMALTGSRIAELMSPDFTTPMQHRDSFRVLLNGFDVPHQLSGREPVHQSLYLWSRLLLQNYILTVLGDRMEMAHSIEGRVPFLDHEVVELVVKMPVSQKIRGMVEKHVLREAARPVLTDTVYRRQKHPFLSPPSTIQTEEPLFELLQDTLRGPALDALPFFDRQAVIGLLDRIPHMDPAERTAHDPVLLHILSLCILQERFGL